MSRGSFTAPDIIRTGDAQAAGFATGLPPTTGGYQLKVSPYTDAEIGGSPSSGSQQKSYVAHGKGNLDLALVDEAIDTVESLDPGEPLTLIVRLGSLCGLLNELWRSAAESSQYHQQILAAAESAAISALRASAVTDSQLAAIRAALKDLTSPILTQANVDSISSLLVDEQFSPLAILGARADVDHE